MRTFVDGGPRYAEWQADAGLPHPPGPAQATLALRDTVDPLAPQVVW